MAKKKKTKAYGTDNLGQYLSKAVPSNQTVIVNWRGSSTPTRGTINTTGPDFLVLNVGDDPDVPWVIPFSAISHIDKA